MKRPTIVSGAGPDEPVGGSVSGIVSGDVVGAVVSGGAVVVVVSGGGGGGGVLVIRRRHGPLMFWHEMNSLDMPTGKVTSKVLPGKPVSVTVSRLLFVTRSPAWGTDGSAASR